MTTEFRKKSIVFFGTPEIAAICLKKIVNSEKFSVIALVTQPDRVSGRGKKLSFSPAKKIAIEFNIPVLQPDNIKTEFENICIQINKLSPETEIDIGVVVAFGQIIPTPIFKLFKAGCINLHTSILPRWRGAAPIQRAIMAGDTVSGVSLMQLEEKLDTGPVFKCEKIDIPVEWNAGHLHDKMAEVGANMLTRNIDKIIDEEISSISQSSEGVSYAKKILKSECHIDWDKSANSIQNKIRGLTPFPGTFSFLNEKRIKITSCSQTEINNCFDDIKPGVCLNLSDYKDRIFVKCSDKLLEINSLKLEGKREMSSKEFLNGREVHHCQLK